MSTSDSPTVPQMQIRLLLRGAVFNLPAPDYNMHCVRVVVYQDETETTGFVTLFSLYITVISSVRCFC